MKKKISQFLKLSKKITELRKELKDEGILLRYDGYNDDPLVQIVFSETGKKIMDMFHVQCWDKEHRSSEKYKTKTLFDIDGIKCFYIE
jgi:hypothetical protein